MNRSLSHLWKRCLLGAVAALAAALAAPGTASASCGDDLTVHRRDGAAAFSTLASLAPNDHSVPGSDRPCTCKGPGCSAVPPSGVPSEPSVPPSREPERAVLLPPVPPAGPDSSALTSDGPSGKPAHPGRDVFHPPR
jgi:hypothetical protein